MKSNFIQIIIPTYNEEKNLHILIKRLSTLKENGHNEYQIIFINDGSKDKTEKIILEHKEKLNLRYIFHNKNKGYSQAIISGINECSSEGHILIMDSDNQFNPLDIRKLEEHIDKNQIVIGHRFKRADNFSRVLLGKTWSLIGRLFFGTKIKDLNSGFKLYEAKVLKSLDLKTQGPGINLEIFSDPKIKKVSFIEVPIEHHQREFGTPSGASFKTLFNSLKDLLIVFGKRFF